MVWYQNSSGCVDRLARDQKLELETPEAGEGVAEVEAERSVGIHEMP